MNSTPRGPTDPEPDHDSTDTLPLPVLRDEDTGRLAALQVPADAEPVRVRPRLAVRDPQAVNPTRTDTFHGTTLVPLAARPVAASDLAETLREQEQRLQQAIHRMADLEADLAAQTRRCSQLEQENATLRASAQGAQVQPAVAVAVPDIPRAPVPQAGAAPDVQPELLAMRRQNERLHEALCSMQARIGVHEAMLGEAEAALREQQAGAGASSDATPAPVAPAPDPPLRIDWQARFIELETVLEAERAAATAQLRSQADRLASLESELQLARSNAAQSGAAAPARALPIGTILRVLVRDEDGTELVYPLGRHTTIGRTPDNDIQVNTTFVSRHHAVLLTSSEHCIVEDLNSTNGIVVNGQRVGRQLLHDGDVVTIGKTHFRYETRP